MNNFVCSAGENANNGKVLESLISPWNSEEFRDWSGMIGAEAEGDFITHIRAYPLKNVQVITGKTIWDDNLRTAEERSEKRLMWPRDTWDEQIDTYRPSYELGIEVVGAYEGDDDINEYSKISIVRATAIAIGWTGTDEYKTEASDLEEIDLNDEILSLRKHELRVSRGGLQHHNDHFLNPYISHQLQEHLDTSGENQAGLLLGDAEGNKVVVKMQDKVVNGSFYPAENNEIVELWGGGSLSLNDRWNGAHEILPSENPFFNFKASINGERHNRGGSVSFSNTNHEFGAQDKLRRSLASIISKLKPLDL